MKILLTGCTGYIGGRLAPMLLDAGHEVVVLVRDPVRIGGRDWAEKVVVVKGDLLQKETLGPAFKGVDAAYYLVHSMLAGKDFEKFDRQAAINFATEAKNLSHLIYLGGLLPRSGKISEHLKSRAQVGQILRDSLPSTEFRSGPIIGSGSASFEMLRYLTERLPVMVAPKWIMNEIQPLAVRDVLSYLLGALKVGPAGVVEIGSEPLSFKEMMLVFAEIRGLRRHIFPVPILAPNLASRWVGLVTPIPNLFAIPIIEGIVQPLYADNEKAKLLFPEIFPIPYKRAVELALKKLETRVAETRWSDALGNSSSSKLVESVEGVINEVRTIKVRASVEKVFRSFTSLGGEFGWPAWNWTFEVRGFIDRILGGPGLRRGRKGGANILVGEAIDFWRVEAIESNHLLRLRAEMKLPGRAWLEWVAQKDDEGVILIQTASFAPKGLSGLLYWYGLYPIHRIIFNDLVKAIAKNAEKENKRV